MVLIEYIGYIYSTMDFVQCCYSYIVYTFSIQVSLPEKITVTLKYRIKNQLFKLVVFLLKLAIFFFVFGIGQSKRNQTFQKKLPKGFGN